MSTYALQILKNIGISERYSYTAATRLKITSYDEGQVIWRKGAHIGSWQLVMSGMVAATAPAERGNSIPIFIYGEGAWFGEQPILNRKPSYLEFLCLTPTQTIGMDGPLLWEIFDSEPAFSKFIAKLVAWRVQRASEMLMLMKLGNPYLRVVLGLAQFAEALAFRSSRPPTDCLLNGIEIPVTQGMLASLCGVSRTLASETLQALAGAGWLSISYGRLQLVSLPIWLRFANRRREQRSTNLAPNIEELLFELSASEI